MTICREWALVKHTPGASYAKPLLCRSWSCDHCAPLRRSQLMARAAAGDATRFLTLTVNPRIGSDPADRLDKLANAWRVLVKRLRRMMPKAEIQYLAVVEETKAGEPHLHILLRSPYIPWRTISAAMDELIGAPIVKIQKINNPKEVVRYIAKYIAKAPKQFGSRKRYWTTQGWELDDGREWEPTTPQEHRWQVEQRSVMTILREWAAQEWPMRHHLADIVIAFPPWRPP